MGGQACILYGAAEFSRDSDFLVLADQENLDLLRSVLEELQAGVIAVPPFEAQYLKKAMPFISGANIRMLPAYAST